MENESIVNDTLMNIKEIMERKCISAEELSKKTGLKYSCTKAIKDGTRKKITLDDLYVISNAFEMNIKELIK